ncbi:MAG: phosphatidylserine/phosphatidylglycerophosphate/cardiolipin synthase family protein [Ignavibacteriales bacterium]|nr:phosphatidylserine/phosphatidylglycerophosphate/cardiolipin synthase family protein [Ignavibacteriales bacterium]
MKEFKIGVDVLDRVIQELSGATEYIRIAVFQLHNTALFNLLNDKLDHGLSVEIITLPYDSINRDIRQQVTALFENFIAHGGQVSFCRWNVGDPERTTTAVNVWYSFHGKFIVTNNRAIALSANLTENPEVDACLIFNDQEVITQFNNKFEELKELFVTSIEGYEGTIRRRIIEVGPENVDRIFELPRTIQNQELANNWILGYPEDLCPSEIQIEDKLYLAPFECRARDFFEKIISEAEEYVYISAESFTDPDIPAFLSRIRFEHIDIKILTSPSSMDFAERVQNTMRNLLASGIEIRSSAEDLHAKVIITDQLVVVSSVNLNKMNLGFKKPTGYWRANTETITVCRDIAVRRDAKNNYLRTFSTCSDVRDKLAEKIEHIIGQTFSKVFNMRSSGEVKKLFAKYVLIREIELKKTINRICQIAARLMQNSNRTLVNKDCFLSALILFLLSERKEEFNDLRNKITLVTTDLDLEALLSGLLQMELIVMEENHYKLNIARVLE